LINGRPVPLAVTQPVQSEEVAGVATADTGATTLAFESPSLFLAIRTPQHGANSTLWALPEDQPSVASWASAETAVTPFLQGWLGHQPRSQLTVLDLPDPEDAPFETGTLLAASISRATEDQSEIELVHALTRAWMTPQSGPAGAAWLTEGVANFMGTLWIEKQKGREQALGNLEGGRAALALAEPASPGESSGQPLAQAISPVYYRTKATYILWMLRDIAGDTAFSAALRGYDPSQDNGRDGGATQFEKLLEQAGTRRDLSWFFSDWVHADKGLPDLSIGGVFPTSTTAGNWLVAVTVENAGYAACEVPVTVRSDATSVTERLLVPARGKAVQRILIQGKPTEAQVNDGTMPESQASVHITTLN
jgi:hypothetical protein